MLNSFQIRKDCEEEAKFLQDHIQYNEKHLGKLCEVFSQYSKKVARVRDVGDEMAKAVNNYSANESVNKSLALGLQNFSNSLSSLSDYSDLLVQNLDSKIVGILCKYEEICKRSREEIKHVFEAREKEIQRKKQLSKIKDRYPRNRQVIAQAEADVLKATNELSKTVYSIEEKATAFERQKLHDLKLILLDFITLQMGYHAKAIEIFSNCYKQVENINEESDLKDFQNARGEMDLEFKKSLKKPEISLEKKGIFNQSTASFGSVRSIFSDSKKSVKKYLNETNTESSSTSNEESDTDESSHDAENMPAVTNHQDPSISAKK
ncbi:CBY1 interacting BAR domain containing protein Fam92 isoform X1 [Rhynchophorus ferrugineus]|uniref:CBY1 interacting BAR domain containing protein Fam92 isoform X1 n=1 Tax=Rhynchophorus ferrugineus TaxID=354439 RepID=UPI003FCC5B3A